MTANKGYSNGTPINTKEKAQKALNDKQQSGKKNALK